MAKKMNLSQREDRRLRPRRRGWVALLPLLLLALLMTGMGILMKDFSKVPMTVVFLITGIASLLTLRGYRVEERVRTFSQGAGRSNLLLMVWIFILAGAFASSAQAMGAVSATVDLTLFCLPSSVVLGGLFLAACVVSICIGTSVGTIVALVPVATEMAQRTGTVAPLMVAAVVGGSFFGDNLSFISDTTVAATRTQGCNMRDKFRTNFRIVLPAALICFFIYVIIGLKGDQSALTQQQALHLWKVLPYALVLILAIFGVNVLLVLCLGTLLTGIVGVTDGAYTMGGWIEAIAKGITGMADLILISMMAGGLLEVVRKGGGVTYLVRGLTRRVHSRRGAEWCISVLVALTNCCTANNTVAILSVGSVAKDISERYGVSRQRAASLLDIFSCIMQGILPYGAQLLMASGLALLSPIDIIPYLFYPMLLAACACISIACYGKGRRQQEHTVTIE